MVQPGDTITPGVEPTPAATQPQEVEVSLHAGQPEQSATEQPPVAQPPVQPDPEPAPVPPVLEDQPAPSQSDPEPNQVPEDTSQPTPVEPVSWTASEYVSHQKSASWFLLVGLALVAVATLVYMLTKDIVAVVVIFIAGTLFAVFSARSPKVLDYSINEQGVKIGQRFYPYNEFKSFAVHEDGPLPSILLMPLKRFLPPITVFFDPQSGDTIINTLSSYLPFEHKQPDAVDKLMSRIRF